MEWRIEILVAFAISIIAVGVTAVALIRQAQTSRLWTLVAIAYFLFLLSAATLVVYLVSPFNPVGVPLLVDSVSSDGFDFMVTQIFTGTTEPYVVRFYYRRNDSGPWYVHYIDHEDLCWRGRIEIDEKKHKAKILNYGTLKAEFDWSSLTFDHFESQTQSLGADWVISGHPLDTDALDQEIWLRDK